MYVIIFTFSIPAAISGIPVSHRLWGKKTTLNNLLNLQRIVKRVRLVLGDLSVVIAPGEADPTRTPLAEIPTPRRAHRRRRAAAKRKADELEQIENRPSGLVNRTVRDAARAETFAWDAIPCH